MTNERREQIRSRLQEMTCVRASDPLGSVCPHGWAPNADGTKTLWTVGPGPSLSEAVTLCADVEPADYVQLQMLLDSYEKSLHVEANEARFISQ
jgi:hypothetical protein